MSQLRIFVSCGVFVLLLWGGAASVVAQEQVTPPIRVASAKQEFSIAQDYFLGLLKRALELGAQGRLVPVVEEIHSMEQKQGLQELVRGRILDVYWMGTDQEREEKLRAILIPLDRGLLGYRRFIIHQSMTPVFDKVNSLDGLKDLIACQGKDWPDAEVLQSADLHVNKVANFERLFNELNIADCDYIPRGYFEAYSELDARSQSYPDLILYQNLILHYPFGLYFFVNKKNEALASWIEHGLEVMIDSGEFLQYMQTHPLTRQAFPLTRSKGFRMINIANPRLPSNTDVENSRYWFQTSDFVDVSN